MWKVKQDVQHNNGRIDWTPVWYNIYIYISQFFFAPLVVQKWHASLLKIFLHSSFVVTFEFCSESHASHTLRLFFLACLLLFLCVSVPFWERLAFSHVLPIILSRKRFRFWNWKTSCMHIGVAHSLEGLNTSRRICIFQHILIQYLGAHLRLRLPSRLSRGWGRLVDLRWHCSLMLTICDVSLQ